MNPFKAWLGINCETVPDDFMLLGVSRDETDLDTIKMAAKLQLKKIKKHENGPHAELAASSAKRIRRAFHVISNPDLREKYLKVLAEQNSARSEDDEIVMAESIDDDVMLAEPVDEIVVPIWSENTASATRQPRAANASRRSILVPCLIASAGVLALGLLAVGSWWVWGTTGKPTETVAILPASKAADAADVNPIEAMVDVAETDEPKLEPSESDESDVLQSGPSEIVVDAQSQSELANVSNLALQAKAILKANCFSCHGEAGEEEGGFGTALDHEKLIAQGHVVPGEPNESVLLERMVEEDSPMPPRGEEPRPTEEEIEIVRQWIAAGAKPFEESVATEFVSRSKCLELIANDLRSLNKRSRSFTRYFSLTHLSNRGDSTSQIETARQAIAKLFNSLSRNRKLASLTPIENLPSVFRVDLRDVTWDDSQWNTMLLDYPYGVITESEDLVFLQESTGCELPIVRGDWFVQSASRPPLYHDLLAIPTTDRELEEQLQVNVSRNIRQERAFRIGFARSGVSQNNRLIERHESAFGAYWKSYDFAGNIERQNLFEYPLGPDNGSDSFQHDGGEIIFQLPNGMLGYMLTDANGNRIDRGPTNIVSDPRQPDRAVINGVSCMSCHYGGFIPKADEVRKHVVANKSAYPDFENIMSLYLTAQETDPSLESDTNKYLKALASSSIGIRNATRAGEPVVLVSTRFSNEIDVATAAAEIGIELPEFQRLLAEATDEELIRQIGVLKTGGVVKRETFDDLFARMIRDFQIGSPTRISTSALAIRRFRERARSRNGFSSSEGRSIIANRHFQLGISEFESERWKSATTNFEFAIKVATDPEDRNAVLQHLIPLYERQASAENLINAHAMLLNSVSGLNESQKAHDQFYHSVLRFVLRKQVQGNKWVTKSNSWDAATLQEMNPIIGPLVGLHEIRLPGSVSNLIRSKFEKALNENPDHEPTLLILQTYYDEIAKDSSKSNLILMRLKKIRERQGVASSVLENLKLANSCMETGDYRKAAKLYHQLNTTSTRSHSLLMREASAHERMGDSTKSLAVLNEAWELYLLNPPSHSRSSTLRSLGAAFLRLNDPDMAIKVFKKASEAKNDKYSRKSIRENLARAYSLSKNVDRNDPEVKELLDPLREFREEAAELEGKKAHDSRNRCQNFIKAAQTWIQAKENEKAFVAIEKASKLLPSAEPKWGIDRLHLDIGNVYRDLGKYENALLHFTAFVKQQDSIYAVEKGQDLIQSLLDGEHALEKTDQIQSLIDPLFKYRLIAQHLEKKSPYNESEAVRNLVKATQLWGKAKEEAEVKRSGKLAESAIEKVDPNYSGLPRFHADLAKCYAANKLFEESIEQYQLAIKRAKRDYDAKRYHRELEQLCQQNDLTAPTLDAASQQKVDPLNKYRRLAKGFEDSARQMPESAPSNLISALENWLKAGDKESATRVADKAGTLLQAAKRDQRFVNSCCRLADLLVHMKDQDAARKYYGLALDSELTASQKAKIEESLSQLDEVNAK